MNKCHDLKNIKEYERVKKMGGEIECSRDGNGAVNGPLRVWSENDDSFGIAMTRSIGDKYFKKIGIIDQPTSCYIKLEAEE